MSNGMQVSRGKKFMFLIILMLVGGSVYGLPYLSLVYYSPLKEALGLVGDNGNTLYGYLGAAYGIANLIFYLPGGYIADKFSAKKLLIISMIGTGLLGFWFSTFPQNYVIQLLIHALWAVTTVLTFWSVYIKYVNVMSASNEQGEMFGWLESGRGLLGIIVTMGGMALFAAMGSKPQDVRYVIWIFSALCVIAGILILFFLPELPKSAQTSSSGGGVTLKMALEAFKQPSTWVLSVCIFCTYFFVVGAGYLTPYMEFGFGLTAAVAGTVAIARDQVARFLSAPIFGGISKKQGRSTGILKISFFCLTLLAISLRFIPGNAKFLIALIAVTFIVGFFAYGNRGVYWAMVEEFHTPKVMVGTVIGVASILGFSPDAFLRPWFGSIMDRYPGQPGFNRIFVILTVVGVLGAVVVFFADRMVRKNQKTDAPPDASISDLVANEAMEDLTHE